jgi:hypothetical protein
VNLRYTGSHPTVFNHPQVGAVEPDAVFWVEDADAEAFLARPDIHEAPEPELPEPARTRKPRKTPDTATPDGDEAPTPADEQST